MGANPIDGRTVDETCDHRIRCLGVRPDGNLPAPFPLRCACGRAVFT